MQIENREIKKKVIGIFLGMTVVTGLVTGAYFIARPVIEKTIQEANTYLSSIISP